MSYELRVMEDELRDSVRTQRRKAEPVTPTFSGNTCTLTLAQLAKAFIITNNSTTAATLYLPPAKDIVRYFKLKKGDGWRFTVRNIGSSTGTITVTANTGQTVSGAVVGAVSIRDFMIVVTNDNMGKEAVTIYGLATSAY